VEPGHHRFAVGDLDCFAVSDGALVCGPPDDPPPAAVLFANAPPAEVDAAVEEAGETLPWMEWTEQITCLLIDTGGQRILIDAGAGDLDPGTGSLIENLAAAGFAPADIDAVIVSHAHPDHIGGLVDRSGSPAFPAARVLLSRKEWRFWMEGEAERVLPVETAAFLIEFAHQTLPALRHRLELVDEEGDLPGGVRFLPTPGHTPGHLAIELSSRNERLLVVGDAILHPLHVERPEWHSVVDSEPVRLLRTRRKLFAGAADEACLVHASHFPFPGLGTLSAADSGWRWTSAF
jgi:glyoxylase-like metal-dependent hydrolase (beta-lactamase superfamily II)